MSSFSELLERNSYVEVAGFEDWETEDLLELEGMIRAELQDRAYRQQQALRSDGSRQEHGE